jgi:serine phosphatase RsbU (regulator of sigma subunit)
MLETLLPDLSAKRTPSKGSIFVQNKLSIYVKFLGQELINPITILTACLIGAAINATQSKDIFFSAVPYVIPLLVQGFAKASLKFKTKDIDLLCQLPAERKDPAFVSDREGRIISAQGITKTFFHDNNIQEIHHLFGNSEVKTILQVAENNTEVTVADPLELYSVSIGKWYQVQTKIGGGDHILIWLDEISSHKAMDSSLSAIRRFSREVINSINELVIKNDIYDRLALIILSEGYRAVFITREDRAGNLSGYVFKGNPDDPVKSELIVVPDNSSAPIWASRRAECDIYGCVASATKSESMAQEEFERMHPFDERVKEFLSFAITNFINYAEGDVSIIAFNKEKGIKKFDSSFINAVVNTARSITRLIDLAIGNNRMLSALELAEEVQQNLLPQKIPIVNGLDIAARIIYCDETGGDYYDFPNVTEEAAGKLNVVIGDVVGHGIAAGLLMATARALIRSRSAQPGSLSEIVTEVNRNLTFDIQETNRFMTLFYLTVDPANKSLSWVRAGHDAALVYNPSTDGFEELFGPGMALGLDENYRYEENERAILAKGELIFLGTDGIWETMNSDGRLFGKQAVRDIMRQNAAASAGEVLDKILFALNLFRESLEPEDDVTLVVVKIEEDS